VTVPGLDDTEAPPRKALAKELGQGGRRRLRDAGLLGLYPARILLSNHVRFCRNPGQVAIERLFTTLRRSRYVDT
jgi:hypothetical protein